MKDGKTRKPRFSLSALIFLSLGLGVAVGIFFGESVAFLSIIGDAFIKLLQMTVLPYVTVALISGLGSLDHRTAGSLFKYGGIAVLVLWLITVVMIVAMPLAFPDWETATFFSTSLVEERESIDILGLYIPANPFFSLANNIVPAVVLFSIALGIALMGVPGKESFLENIKVLAAGLTGITNFVIRLTPIGVFGIAASAAGTLRLEDLEMLQVYGAVYVLMALTLAFWGLPALVTTVLPLRYRDVIHDSRDILITAFATGSVFVVLPLLAERAKKLVGSLVPEENREPAASLVDVVVPTAFSFPSVGTVLILSFVLFAGWLAGTPVGIAQYPVFIVSGILSVFGGVYVGIPFVLDMLRIPADTFNLLVIFNQVVSSRFGAMLAAISILSITLLATGAVGGLLKIRLRGLLRYAVVTVALLAVSVVGVRVFFNNVVAHQYAGYQMFIDLELLEEPVEATVEAEPPAPFPLAEPGETAVERFRRRGALRVGYLRDLLPWAFVNSASHLVGFDVEMAHTLARDLGVRLEFVRLEYEQMADCLNAGYCDIIMSGLAVTTDRAEKMSFTASYLDQTLAFIVEDARREEFNSREAVHGLRNLRIGTLDVPYFIRMLEAYLPDATVVPLDTARQFFRDEDLDLDALVYSAEGGSAWCLIYPRYTVAIPHPDVAAVPLAYPVARGETEMRELVSTWVELKKRDGTVRRSYEHWILGKGAESRGRRWCVARDVLHWLD